MHPFEGQCTIGTVERESGAEPDAMADDTALAYCGAEGLSIVTGCSHAGICNILTYAKDVTGEQRIHSILGGLHLFETDRRTEETIRFLQREGIPLLYPCHCTSFAVRAALYARCPDVREVAVGTALEWK